MDDPKIRTSNIWVQLSKFISLKELIMFKVNWLFFLSILFSIDLFFRNFRTLSSEGEIGSYRQSQESGIDLKQKMKCFEGLGEKTGNGIPPDRKSPIPTKGRIREDSKFENSRQNHSKRFSIVIFTFLFYLHFDFFISYINNCWQIC